MIPLVLASGSPRRRTVLAALGLSFDVRPPELVEELRAGESAAAAARRLAEEKAAAVDASADELILAADTIVALDGALLGKPAHAADAAEMLAGLAGRAHTVVTGIALRRAGGRWSAVARTDVTFRRLERAEIDAYVATGEPLDKAGAYGIQGYGAALVERIEGDFYNVMGLPIPALLGLLEEAGCRYEYGAIVGHGAPPSSVAAAGRPGADSTAAGGERRAT